MVFCPAGCKIAATGWFLVLVFVVLAVVSSLIIVIFRSNEIAMLPLYALGVMLSFTLSQAGMSR